MATLQTVRKLALSLPRAEESTSYGQPAFKVTGKMFACLPSHPSAEPDSLVIRLDFDQRAALLEEAPEIFYITDHYKNYPAVLIRLKRVKPDALKDLLTTAHRFVQPRGNRGPSAP